MTDRIQLLDDLGAEFSRVSVADEQKAHTRRPFRAGARARSLFAALLLTGALGGTAYALPATRTVVDGIANPLVSWISGESDKAPGRALTDSDNLPSWLETGNDADVRLIAETDGVGLYVNKTESDNGPLLSFTLGQARGITAPIDYWRDRLGRKAIVILGDAIFGGARGVIDSQGRVPLFGVTANDVDRVELRYDDGPPLVSDTGDGGVVLLVDAWRQLQEAVAYDATGRVLGQADVSSYDLRYLCQKEPGCP